MESDQATPTIVSNVSAMPLLPKSRFSRRGVLVGATIVAVLLLFLAIVFALANQNKNLPANSPNIPTDEENKPNDDSQSGDAEVPGNPDTNSDDSDNGSTLPSAWAYKQSAACDVGIPLPPKVSPYLVVKGDIESYWIFQEQQDPIFYEFKFDALAQVIYLDFMNGEILGSGYAAGMVSVYCETNSTQDTTAAYTDKIIAALESQTTYFGEDVDCVASSTEVSLWGKSVNKIGVECKRVSDNSIVNQSTYYVFASVDKGYVVQTVSDATRDEAKVTVQILENLKFGI